MQDELLEDEGRVIQTSSSGDPYILVEHGRWSSFVSSICIAGCQKERDGWKKGV